MAITSNDDVADFRGAELVTPETGPSDAPAKAGDPAAAPDAPAGVWVLCRKRENGDVETIRAFTDAARARADLELAESVSDDDFWVSAVPLIDSAPAQPEPAAGEEISRVQALALTWLAQGAEAEASVPLDDPVVVSPRHVRGFVSVPAHEWREMEERGWVRDGLITPDGAGKVGQTRDLRTADED